MSEVTLHPAPHGGEVVREQIRIVGLGLRPVALVAAVVVAILTVMIAFYIVRGNAAEWFDSDEWSGFGVLAFLFPFAVWRGERRFGPAFLWTLPVDRRRLALAKVFAGWVWLIAALTAFILWQLVLALVSGVDDPQIVSLQAFTGVTALYLLGSALVLGLRHPLRWLLGGVSLFFLIGYFGQRLDRGPYDFATLVDSTGFPSAWRTLPHLARWAISTILGLGAGLAALLAAVSRHGERRRH